MRVFLGLVNYGTQAGVLAEALRRRGIEARAFTVYDKYRRATDYEFRLANGLLDKLVTYLCVNPLIRISCFFRFDTFLFFFGKTLLPRQLDLPFYRVFGKTVVMEYLGWDVQQALPSINKYRYTNARYYKDVAPEELERQDEAKRLRVRRETRFCDALLVCAPYLSEFVPHADLLPLAIADHAIESIPKAYRAGRPLRILHAPTHTGNKGTNFLEEALEKLEAEGLEFEYIRVENVSHEQLSEAYRAADVFVDQLVAGWYGTASIEAMATGCPTVCFLRESYAEYCPYYERIPIIRADAESIYTVMKTVLLGQIDLGSISELSLKFVRDIHAADKIAGQLLTTLERCRRQ